MEITGSYNVWLVAVSVALAMLSSYAALDVAGRVTAARARVRAIWLACGALAMGLGIWSMHYIGMLALQLSVPVAYDWPTVLLSLLAAVGASAVALAIVSRPQLTRSWLAGGGLAMGLGIASMHYIGMQAMRLNAICVYDPRIVALSIIVAILASIVALRLAFQLRSEQRSFTRGKFGGALLLGAAIPLMHYCGMAAVTFVPGSGMMDISHSLVITSVGLTDIVVATALVLTVAIVASFTDRRMHAQLAELNLRQHRLDTLSTVSINREQRILALASVARDADGLSFDERARAILKSATATIRPAYPTVGVLTHLDRGTIVVDHVETFGADDEVFDRVLTILYPGSTFVLARTLHAAIHQAGRTLAWTTIPHTNDIAANGGSISHDFGVQSLIGTPVFVGSKVHFVVFEFLRPMSADPLVEEDIAFIDVVAAFLSNGYQRELQAERLSYQMEHDATTGLGNRVQLRRAAASCVASQDPFAIAVLNLDRFREINLTFGQLIGDELLVEVATTLAEVDDRDLVSRRSGDEFAILLRAATASDIALRLERYVQSFSTPFHTGDRDGTRLLSIHCSFGVALYPRDGATIDAIMLRAEAALDAAKHRGGGALLFTDEMERNLAKKWLDLGEIQRAIANDEFELLYQPTFDLATRSVIGAEALIRWNHPSRGTVMPGEFVPFSERNGLIRSITLWVFARLMRDLRSTHALPAQLRCYINLPAGQLDDAAFLALVQETLRVEPTLAKHVGFEITESGMMLNVRSSIETLKSFRHCGIAIAIDDFGTGYSSLSYLKHVPADIIKIDQSFVAGIPHDQKDMTLADTFIWLANAFGFVTLAEGIESEEQADWLAQHGCRNGQGFLVAAAMPFGAFLNLVAQPDGVRA